MRARNVYDGSDGEVTRGYYRALATLGPLGQIAMNLFRASKKSYRAKRYRGRHYTAASYDVKDYSLEQLCAVLSLHASALRITWGWAYDPKSVNFEHVLYVDLPTGQVSFHLGRKLVGPDYAGTWDGQSMSAQRIIAWCDSINGLEITEKLVADQIDAKRADEQAIQYRHQQELFS